MATEYSRNKHPQLKAGTPWCYMCDHLLFNENGCAIGMHMLRDTTEDGPQYFKCSSWQNIWNEYADEDSLYWVMTEKEMTEHVRRRITGKPSP